MRSAASAHDPGSIVRSHRCSEGSFNPLSIDVIASPGEYVAPDGSGVLPCPVGMSCPGGGRV